MPQKPHLLSSTSSQSSISGYASPSRKGSFVTPASNLSRHTPYTGDSFEGGTNYNVEETIGRHELNNFEKIKIAKANYQREALDKMTPEQLDRYEFYRRSHFPQEKIKDLMRGCFASLFEEAQVTRKSESSKNKDDKDDNGEESDNDREEVTEMGIPNLSDEMVIAVNGLTKVFVKDLVRESREDMEIHKEEGSIQPRHLRGAYRKLQKRGYFHLLGDWGCRGKNNNVGKLSRNRDTRLLHGKARTRSSKGIL